MVLISCTNRSALNTAGSSACKTLSATLRIVYEIFGEIDGGHAPAPFAEAGLDAVAIGEGGREPGGGLGRGRLR